MSHFFMCSLFVSCFYVVFSFDVSCSACLLFLKGRFAVGAVVENPLISFIGIPISCYRSEISRYWYLHHHDHAQTNLLVSSFLDIWMRKHKPNSLNLITDHIFLDCMFSMKMSRVKSMVRVKLNHLRSSRVIQNTMNQYVCIYFLNL